MVLFLSSAVRLSNCYTYVTFALSSALRMGLHHSISIKHNLIEQETRKRLFWAIRLVSNYTAVFIGLPKLLHDEDVDQEMPLEVDDTCIEKLRILPQPLGKIPTISGANSYTRLQMILERVVRDIYPLKGMRHGPRKGSLSCMVSVRKVQEIEAQLREWSTSLPAGLRLKDKTTGSPLR